MVLILNKSIIILFIYFTADCCNDEFMCKNGNCIHRSKLCDDVVDGENGDDEKCGPYRGKNTVLMRNIGLIELRSAWSDSK